MNIAMVFRSLCLFIYSWTMVYSYDQLGPDHPPLHSTYPCPPPPPPRIPSPPQLPPPPPPSPQRTHHHIQFVQFWAPIPPYNPKLGPDYPPFHKAYPRPPKSPSPPPPPPRIPSPPQPPPPPPPPLLPLAPYHHILFVLLWAPTYCRTDRCKSKFKLAKFYVHGLWPVDADGNSCIVNSRPTDRKIFKEKISQTLKNKLEKSWPSISENYGDDHIGFWLHEWNDHGLCSETALPILKYLTKTFHHGENVDLRVKGELKKNSIVPGPNIYRKNHTAEALNAEYPGAYFTCFNGTLLRELFICLDQLAENIITCPPKVTNCGSDIKLPIDF